MYQGGTPSFLLYYKKLAGTASVDMQTAVDLIANTTTASGLTVICQTDDTVYKLGLKVPDDLYSSINLVRMDTLGDWNYSIHGFLS